MILKNTKGLVLIFTLMISSSCSDGSSQVQGLETEVNEFTAFHPVTGKPLKPEDLTEEILKEDDYIEGAGRGDIQTMEIHETGVDIEKAKDVMAFGYTPDGSYNSNLTSQCYRTEVERMVSSYSGQVSNLAQSFQPWIHRCEKELSRYRTNSISTILRFANTNYDITGNKIKHVEIEFDDKSKLGALLGLKSGKRPLVIFKAGVYANAADDTVARNFFMHLFEESPFHMLFLANVTGTDYMKTNKAVALGGMDEGRQILEIVEMLNEDAEYNSLIEDIHVVGVSLGSHGVLYSSLYNSNDSNYSRSLDKKIKSAVALCPVVNLEPTMISVFETTVAGIYYSILTSITFKSVYDHVPILREYLDPSGIWSQSDLYKASTQSAFRYYKEKTENELWDMAPLNGAQVQAIEDYWKLNNFIEYADHVKTPTLVVHARDDFLVQSAFNSDDLLKKTQNNNSQIGVLEFQNGSHCAFNVANGWPTMSSLLREFILKHSSYEEDTGGVVKLDFKDSNFNSNQKITKFTFKAEKNKNYVELDIKYFDSRESAEGGKSCKRYDPLYASNYCYKNKVEKIDLGKLMEFGVSVPESNFEAERLTRWLNTHGTLLDKNSEIILGKNLLPVSLYLKSKADFQ